ncbi:MAG: Hsp70 family protein, partial [bacterium]
RKAAEDGGFETVKLLDESVAAILATGIKEEGKVLLVYVMGAGVFTASVIKIVNGVPSALWHEGERRLGGNNFDEIIVRHLLETLHLDAQAFNSSPITIPKLKQIAEKAKIELSKRETVDLSSAIRDLFSADPEFQFPENVILDRMAFEGMIADHINHTVQLTERALEKAKVMPQDIGSIMLLGGSTKIPLIEKVIHEKFGLKVRRGSDALIVTGAAIHSARALTPIKKIPEKTEPQAPKKPQARKPPEPIEKHSWLKMFEPKLISAHHAWQQGEQKQAITVMEEHLDEISQFIAHLYFTRGEYLFKKEDYNQAIAHFQKGLKLDNDIHRIHKSYHLACNRYALQLFNKGLPHEAKNVIKIGVQLDPSCKACLGLRNNINAAISKQPGLVGIRKKGKKKRR